MAEKERAKKLEDLKTQAELEELPRNTMTKSIRNIEEILADVATGAELSPTEERLVDRITHEKTGKRFGKFKLKKGKKKRSMVVISSRPDGRGQKLPEEPKLRTRKDPPVVQTNASVNAGASTAAKVS